MISCKSNKEILEQENKDMKLFCRNAKNHIDNRNKKINKIQKLNKLLILSLAIPVGVLLFNIFFVPKELKHKVLKKQKIKEEHIKQEAERHEYLLKKLERDEL